MGQSPTLSCQGVKPVAEKPDWTVIGLSDGSKEREVEVGLISNDSQETEKC